MGEGDADGDAAGDPAPIDGPDPLYETTALPAGVLLLDSAPFDALEQMS